MDKLKELLKQLGGSDALAAAICEEFNRHAQTLKEQYEKEFKTKLEKAKSVCIEEVNKEKANLARKVSVYLEAKNESIEKAAEKQRLNEDTEATALLKRQKALLEGISIEDGGQSRDLQAARKQVERLKAAVVTLKEERNVAVDKANRANKIALETLERNRLLESKTPKSDKPVVTESKDIKPAAPAAAPATAPKRLDGSRRVTATPTTTRRPIVESQVSGKKATQTASQDTEIAKIASSMPED
jgi:hypothetical protein